MCSLRQLSYVSRGACQLNHPWKDHLRLAKLVGGPYLTCSASREEGPSFSHVHKTTRDADDAAKWLSFLCSAKLLRGDILLSLVSSQTLARPLSPYYILWPSFSRCVCLHCEASPPSLWSVWPSLWSALPDSSPSWLSLLSPSPRKSLQVPRGDKPIFTAALSTVNQFVLYGSKPIFHIALPSTWD